jgi:hypothetical protein
METFREPETLAFFDRVWNGQREQLRLECSEYKGHPFYTLRLYWQNEDGDWRWQRAKPSSAGRYWAALNLKPKELHQLGLALLQEAAELVHREQSAAYKAQAEPAAPRSSRTPTARERAALDGFSREHPPMRDDPDIPF